MSNITTDLQWNGDTAKRDFKKMMYKSLYEGSAIVEGQAKSNVPVDTALLKDSLNKQVDEATATVGTNVLYAPFVEFGTRFQKAQPYLLPALLDNINKIIARFKANGINLKWVNK